MEKQKHWSLVWKVHAPLAIGKWQGHCRQSCICFAVRLSSHAVAAILHCMLSWSCLILFPCFVQVLHFPFPTSPEAGALKAAQACLVALSALQAPSHPSQPLGLTPLGKAMSAYPITPRHSRMLLQVAYHSTLFFVIVVAAFLIEVA